MITRLPARPAREPRPARDGRMPGHDSPPWGVHTRVVLLYAIVAVAFTWPLAAHLHTHLTGVVFGDAGVYVWNHWVFRHELIEHGRWPFFTTTLFGGARPENLSLHNYTVAQNLIALPIGAFAGAVATFNVVYLLMTVLTAYAAFLLALQVTGRTGESCLAGLLFAWSPLLVTRAMGHVSLVAAAPLLLFLLLLVRPMPRAWPGRAALLGITMAWAAASDVYYGVFCLLAGGLFLATRVVRLDWRDRSPRDPLVRALNGLLACLALLAAAMALTGGWEIQAFGGALGMRSLWGPMAVLTLIGVLRLALHVRAARVPLAREQVSYAVRTVGATGLVCGLALSPVLSAAALRAWEGEFTAPPIFWRSSPRGVDALAVVLPNPNHPLVPRAVEDWIVARPNGHLENVVSVPWVALGVLIVAWRRGWRPSRWWAGLALVFGLLALGPFIHVAGMNTYVPGPWALLRYVPVLGLAHTPARFAVVLVLAVAIMFASALVWLGARAPAARRRLLAVATLLVLLELVPVPRPLHGAEIPEFYRIVAEAPAGVTLLELPFGIRDGTLSVGDFTARTQFHQTGHGRPIMGGYLSRVSPRRVQEVRTDPVLHGLTVLGEHGRLSATEEAQLRADGTAFLGRWNIGFVVIDHGRTPGRLADLAMDALQLRHLATEGELSLYATPRQAW